MLRSVVFFYIKTPLRVKEAGLEELIPTTWWPTHFDKEVGASPPCHPPTTSLAYARLSAIVLFPVREKMSVSPKTRVRMSVCGGELTSEDVSG